MALKVAMEPDRLASSGAGWQSTQYPARLGRNISVTRANRCSGLESTSMSMRAFKFGKEKCEQQAGWSIVGPSQPQMRKNRGCRVRRRRDGRRSVSCWLLVSSLASSRLEIRRRDAASRRQLEAPVTRVVRAPYRQEWARCECGGGGIGPHPHAGEGRWRRREGDRVPPDSSRSTLNPDRHHHTTTLACLGHPHEQIITCSVMCLWLGENLRKSKTALCLSGTGCALSFDARQLAASLMQAWQIKHGRQACHSRHQPIPAPFEKMLAMIIMTTDPASLSGRTTTWLASTLGRPSMMNHGHPHDRTDPFAPHCGLPRGWDQAGWRQSQPTVEEPSTTHQQRPPSPPFSLPSEVTQTHVLSSQARPDPVQGLAPDRCKPAPSLEKGPAPGVCV